MLGVQWCHLHSRTDWPADVRQRSCAAGCSRGGIRITGSTPLGSRARRMGSASVQLCAAAHSGGSARSAPGSAPSAADRGNSRGTQAQAGIDRARCRDGDGHTSIAIVRTSGVLSAIAASAGRTSRFVWGLRTLSAALRPFSAGIAAAGLLESRS